MKSQPHTTGKRRVVKAWAILSGTSIENADYFLDSDCCCCEESAALAVYPRRVDALNKRFSKVGMPVVRVEIVYTLPKKGRV